MPANTFVCIGGDEAAAELKAQELAFVEQVPVSAVAPAVEPVGLIAGKDVLVRDK